MIKTQSLSKSFKKLKALDQINLQIPTNKIVGLAGHNGCGKSTLIKIITGQILNFEGEINMMEISTGEMSLVSEALDIPKYYTVKNALKLFEVLKGGSAEQTQKVVEQLLLQSEINKKISELSQGNRKRLNIAIALLGNSKFIILDEPNNGLDPDGFILLRKLIKELHAEGIGFLIASHILSELESMCDEVILMRSGKVMSHMQIDQIKETHGSLESAYSAISQPQ